MVVAPRRILLAHGFTGAKEDFDEVVPRLEALGWEVVAPDLRGHGPGPHPEGRESYSLSLYADDLLRLADELGWDRFVLLGLSMGGMAAQLVALAHPERLAGLVLASTGHGPPDGVDPTSVAAGRLLVEAGGLAALVEATRGRDDEFATVAHRRLLAERPGWAEYGDAKLLACSPDMWVAMATELVEQEDRLPRLAELRVPSLVIVGAQDRVFLEQSRRVAATVPGAKLVVLPDAGHAPQFEQPEEWWRSLAAFLDALEVG
jgi:3-oxoadipate enol-lactonase